MPLSNKEKREVNWTPFFYLEVVTEGKKVVKIPWGFLGYESGWKIAVRSCTSKSISLLFVQFLYGFHNCFVSESNLVRVIVFSIFCDLRELYMIYMAYEQVGHLILCLFLKLWLALLYYFCPYSQQIKKQFCHCWNFTKHGTTGIETGPNFDSWVSRVWLMFLIPSCHFTWSQYLVLRNYSSFLFKMLWRSLFYHFSCTF